MHDKNYYRATFDSIKDIVKLCVCADYAGIPRSSMTQFMKGEMFNYMISLDKLEIMYKYIQERLSCL